MGKIIIPEAILPAWQIEYLPGQITADEYLRMLNERGIGIEPVANDAIKKIIFEAGAERIKIGLTKNRVTELGLKNGQIFEDICFRGQKFELSWCTPESVLQLCLQQDIQLEEGKWLLFVMKPIPDSSGAPCMFALRKDKRGKLWLGLTYASPKFPWISEEFFTFKCSPSLQIEPGNYILDSKLNRFTKAKQKNQAYSLFCLASTNQTHQP